MYRNKLAANLVMKQVEFRCARNWQPTDLNEYGFL